MHTSLLASERSRRFAIAGLRWSLALIFIWFGGLKVFGYNPVYEIVNSTWPMFATPVGNQVLGWFEMLIGIALVINTFPAMTHAVLLGHLAGTFATFIIAPHLMFEPYFPILTLAGEFVFKNVTLAMAGIVILLYEKHQASHH